MPRKRKTTVTLEAKRGVHYQTKRANTKQEVMTTPIKALAEFSGLSEADLKRMKRDTPHMFGNIAVRYRDQQRRDAFIRTLNK